MKAVIQKELRENLKLAALGFVLFTVLLFNEYYHYNLLIKHLVRGSVQAQDRPLQPLTSTSFQVITALVCLLLAAVLGWCQIHNERHRDLWTFLVHRPISRTSIFLGKVIAGLGLYLLAAGLPLFAFIFWASIPGHVAAPFEWSLLGPIAALFLAGPACYFAGMLVAGRQARWYASRALPLPTAFLVSTVSMLVPHFWQGLLVLAVGGAILGMAAWGSFHTNGFFLGQPPLAKSALSVGMALGALVVIFAGVAVCSIFLQQSSTWSYYGMTSEGTIYKVTAGNNQPTEIADLNGNPLKDDKTGLPYSFEEVNRNLNLNVPWFSVEVNFNGRSRPQPYFQEPASFTLWRDIPGTLWFYWGRYGRLVVFDVKSRRAVGSLGPNGFSSDVAGDGARFQPPPIINQLGPPFGGAMSYPLIYTASAVYSVDFIKPSAAPIFTTPADDPIGAIGACSWTGQFQADRSSALTAVVTRHFVYLVGVDGKVEWKTPYQGRYPNYNQLKLYRLRPEGHCALWLLPDPKAQQEAHGKLPVEVTWSADSQTNKTAQVPDLAAPGPAKLSAGEVAMSLLASPGITTFVLLLPDQFGATRLRELWLSLAAAVLLCLLIGIWLGHRYQFGLRAQLSWAAFHLVFGIPGLLAFLSVQEWPARERCPNCRRLRVVNREHCQHCAAAFPASAPTGVEIFEPAQG